MMSLGNNNEQVDGVDDMFNIDERVDGAAKALKRLSAKQISVLTFTTLAGKWQCD